MTGSMAKRYYPDRVEHDIAARGRSGQVIQWLTSDVADVAGGHLFRRADRSGRQAWEATADGLRELAESRIEPLREFASHGRVPPEDVRAVIRDGSGLLLADVRCNGTVLLPDDIDLQVRRRFVSMLNGGLPLAIRDVDRSRYGAALATVAGARRLLDDLIAEIAALALRQDGLTWTEVGQALDLPPDVAREWYGRRPGGDASAALDDSGVTSS
jgi:hypothetical protein